jgi:hypothetical protein
MNQKTLFVRILRPSGPPIDYVTRVSHFIDRPLHDRHESVAVAVKAIQLMLQWRLPLPLHWSLVVPGLVS